MKNEDLRNAGPQCIERRWVVAKSVARKWKYEIKKSNIFVNLL
jgi:hypothetical protein